MEQGTMTINIAIGTYVKSKWTNVTFKNEKIFHVHSTLKNKKSNLTHTTKYNTLLHAYSSNMP